jgi:hypothetical protein
MGRLAAVNTLSVIRAHMPESMQSKFRPPDLQEFRMSQF